MTSSPFLLNATIRHHDTNYNESKDPHFVKDFLNALHVDDFNGRKDNVSDAFELYSKAKSRMKDGGFNFKKWKLMQWIDHEEKSFYRRGCSSSRRRSNIRDNAFWSGRQYIKREKDSWCQLRHYKRHLHYTF